MAGTRVFLFSKFCLYRGEQALTGLESQKAQELFCYLLLYRGRAHAREKLADLLWNQNTIDQSRRYLRQALWQLQSVLDSPETSASLLLADSDWLQVNTSADLWLDVGVFEQAFEATRGRQGRALTPHEVATLRAAAQLYRGDLLENWYQEWCLFERERLHNMFLAILDKLMDYCEVQQEYEHGMAYGEQILRSDPARERPYRRLMRIYYLAGDRTGALRQYDRCVAALERELGVEPAERTKILYELLRRDQPAVVLPAPEPAAKLARPLGPTDMPVSELLHYLHDLRLSLAQAYRQVEQDIHKIQMTFDKSA